MSDFDYGILNETAHRPWPMPDALWVMTQTWHHLLFAHWPIDVAVLRTLVPNALPLDTFDGQAWVGLVPFYMTNVGVRGLPSLPFVSEFGEMNVRTYVTVDGKPGVYFFSLDAGSSVAVATARTMLGLPYFTAEFSIQLDEDEVLYHCRRDDGAAEFRARYRPTGSVQPPEPTTLEYFLAERYCLYTVDDGRVRRLDIHHPRWPLQPATAEIAVNTMAGAEGIVLPAVPPLLHFARRQDIVAWTMRSA